MSRRTYQVGDRVEVYRERPDRPGRHAWQPGTVTAVDPALFTVGKDYTIELDHGQVVIERVATINPDLRAAT